MAKRFIRRILNAAFGYSPRVGDVVRDRFDGADKTVERIDANRVSVAWFARDKLKRGTLLTRNVEFVR